MIEDVIQTFCTQWVRISHTIVTIQCISKAGVISTKPPALLAWVVYFITIILIVFVIPIASMELPPEGQISYFRDPLLCSATSATALVICDWICEKGSYTRNYKYLEIPI